LSSIPGTPGATRQCPHCRETILESSAICPNCRHYLRLISREHPAAEPAVAPLRVEGTIRHPPEGEPWEYTVVVTVRNERNEEIAHKLVNVGAMHADEQCTFTLVVEAVPARGRGSRGTRH
jgi:hypothetical protein